NSVDMLLYRWADKVGTRGDERTGAGDAVGRADQPVATLPTSPWRPPRSPSGCPPGAGLPWPGRALFAGWSLCPGRLRPCPGRSASRREPWRRRGGILVIDPLAGLAVEPCRFLDGGHATASVPRIKSENCKTDRSLICLADLVDRHDP